MRTTYDDWAQSFRKVTSVGMEISTGKSKTMVITREPQDCNKWENNRTSLRIQLSRNGHIGLRKSKKTKWRSKLTKQELWGQWKNRCVSIESKIRIQQGICSTDVDLRCRDKRGHYKKNVPYEIKVLRIIISNTLLDHKRSDDICRERQTED